jgi:hypothetical protein
VFCAISFLSREVIFEEFKWIIDVEPAFGCSHHTEVGLLLMSQRAIMPVPLKLNEEG